MERVNNSNFRVCLIQFECKGNLSETLTHLRKMVSIAVEKHQPRIIALPECFYIPYETTPSVIMNAAESIPNGETCKTLSELAKKYSVYIVGGSIVERDSANLLYNTSTVWSPNGELIARHRKVHLCDVHFENGLDIDEVSTLTAGNDATTFEVDGVKCGVAICHDGSFDEFIKIYGKIGCHVLFVPAAYPKSFGSEAWELNQRARAVDNQFFVAAISPARKENVNYVVYGYSMIIDPCGNILTQAGHAEDIVCSEIDFNVLQKIRKELPLYNSRRKDVYQKYEQL